MWYLILSSFLWFFKVGPSAFKLSSHGHDIHIIADASSSVTVKVCFIWRLFLIALRRHWLIVRHPGRSKERWSAFAVTWTAKLFLNCVILSVARSRLELWWPLLINWTTAIKESNASGCLTKSEASYGRWSSLLSFFYNTVVLSVLSKFFSSEEQNTCHNKHDLPLTPMPSPPSSPPNDGCIIRRTLVVVRSSDEAKCFSTSTVKECRPSCYGLYGHFKPTIVGE